jgi:signal transduction histidine kinase
MARAYQELNLDHQYAKHHLRESEENLRELVSAMPAAVYAFDTDGIITYYNQHARELWGRRPELYSSPWSFFDSRPIYSADGVLIRPEESPARTVIATGAAISNREFLLERPDSSRINVLANIVPLRDSSGVVTGAVSVIQDISELKAAQQDRESLLQELERSNRDLSEFSYAVSHDLQAPVRTVRALTQLLVQRDGASNEGTAHLLTLIEQASVGMERLIESLLRYAQAGQGQLDRKRVPVDQIIESIKATLNSLIAETEAQIVGGPLPEVEADPVLIEHLFQNLISNSLQYRRPGEAPVVEISAVQTGGLWEFSLKDNGQGIPIKYRDDVFEPLKRLHGSDTPGTGLGLALCRTIIARHGGRIWIDSQGSGHGTTFRFTLPIGSVSIDSPDYGAVTVTEGFPSR